MRAQRLCVAELLVALLQNSRADAQVAAADAAAAAFRFVQIQTEFVAQNGIAPLTAVLRLHRRSSGAGGGSAR